MEGKRQLIKLVLPNLRVEGEDMLYDVARPFDEILKYADYKEWRLIVDMFCNGGIEMDITLQRTQTAFSLLFDQLFRVKLPNSERTQKNQNRECHGNAS